MLIIECMDGQSDQRQSEADIRQYRDDLRSSGRERWPNSTIDQSEVLQESLNTLENSRRGYLSTLTRNYNQLDLLLTSYNNVTEVKELHTKIRSAWIEYEACCPQCLTKANKETELYKRISEQYEEQIIRKQNYDTVIEQYVGDSLVYYNRQDQDDVTRTKSVSVGSLKSSASRISTATYKLREAKLAASRAALFGSKLKIERKEYYNLN